MDRLKEGLYGVLNLSDDPAVLAAGGLLMIILIILGIAGYTLHKGKKVPGEEPMKREKYIQSKRLQRRVETSLIADEVEVLLLRLFVEGKITEERYQAWHLRFGKQLGLSDLLPIPVKLTAVQRRRAHENRKKNGYFKPVKFPAEAKKTSILDRILNKHYEAPAK